MRTTTKTMAVLALAALTATACGSKSSGGGSASGTSPSPSASTAAFKACMVTDTGGIDDRSFNQSAWEGIQNAEVTWFTSVVQGQILLQSHVAERLHAQHQRSSSLQNCGKLIVTVGFLMGDATKAAATAHPNQKFADRRQRLLAGDQQHRRPAVLHRAGRLPRRLPSRRHKSSRHRIATYGGQNIGPVTIYMDGYSRGRGPTTTRSTARTRRCSAGTSPSRSSAPSPATSPTRPRASRSPQTLMSQGADVIFPVAGATSASALPRQSSRAVTAR